jgi:lysine-N-methylase
LIYIKPWFFDKFKCIADKCTDNCCIGWEIDVDDETLSKYNQVKGNFGERIAENLIESDDGSTCFHLCENERCAFLNKDNLCDIIINCGEDYLCDICHEHPRFYEWFPGVTECGLGLCCEEVCRILLESEEDFSLVEYNDGEEITLQEKDEIAESDTYIFISAFRESLFDILFNKTLPFEEKLIKILSKTESFTGEKIKLRNDKNLLSLYMKTEPIDENWKEFISDLNSTEIGDTSILWEPNNKTYSKLLSYILYRHLIKSVFDGCIAQRVCFAVESLRFITMCDMKNYNEKGSVSLTDRIDNIKRWSKQVEYSEENTEILIFGEEING